LFPDAPDGGDIPDGGELGESAAGSWGLFWDDSPIRLRTKRRAWSKIAFSVPLLNVVHGASAVDGVSLCWVGAGWVGGVWARPLAGGPRAPWTAGWRPANARALSTQSCPPEQPDMADSSRAASAEPAPACLDPPTVRPDPGPDPGLGVVPIA